MSPEAQLEGQLGERNRSAWQSEPSTSTGMKTPQGSEGLEGVSLPLPASPQPPWHPTIPPLSLLTGPTVTTLGSYEVSEGCERKKGQRWGSLERRGMQAMEGEFSHTAFSPSPSPNFPSSL